MYRQPERHFEIAKSIDIQGPATTADTAKEDVADSAAPESALPPSRQVQSIPSEVKEEAIAEQAGVRPITDEMPLRDVLQEQQPSQEIHELLPVPEIAEPDFPWRGPEEVSPAIQEPPSIITTHPAHKSVPAEKTATIPGKKTISISDLPPSIRNGLPPISITGHIYSDNPSARIININGDIFREGESVTEGLKVEEITPTGVILGFKGHRFHIRVF
jgi:general secretion pathway protein B